LDGLKFNPITPKAISGAIGVKKSHQVELKKPSNRFETKNCKTIKAANWA
jgi:hypothetical protein